MVLLACSFSKGAGDKGKRPRRNHSPALEQEPVKKRRCTASWARLIAKVFHSDPLTCRKCGGTLEIVAYLHDPVAIKQILDHLGLSPDETRSRYPETTGRFRVDAVF